MLVEKKREVPENLLRIAKPSPARDRIEKSQRFAYVENSVLLFDDSNSVVTNLNELIFECVGYNTIVYGNVSEFHKFLDQITDCRELFENRIMEWDNCKIYLADRAATFFNVRKGNVWGSIWCDDWDEYGSIDYANSLSGLNHIGWGVDRLMPAGKMAEHILKRVCIGSLLPNFPSGMIDDIHIDRAFNCFRGSRMECSKLGKFNNVYNVDHNSAFLAIVRDLPAIIPGFVKWVDTKEYCSDAVLGFCYCRTYISEHSPFGLVATRVDFPGRKTRLFYNVGESEGWRTKDEIDLIRKSGVGEVDIISGSWAIPIRELPRPFAPVAKILEESMNYPNTVSIAKMVASILWGKFASVYPNNSLWNPIYASEVTAKMRTRLSEISLAKERDVIAFTVDGIDIKNLPDDVVHSSESVGGTRISQTERMLSLTDFYRYDWKDKKSWELYDDAIVIRTKVTLPYSLKFGGKIGDELTVVKIPFGSSKRVCPSGLTAPILEKNQFDLFPPNPEECVDLFFSKDDFVPWDL